MPFAHLSPEQAQAGGKILDVCEPAEHEALHIPGATNVPLSRLEAEAKGLDPQQPYVLACRSGKRAQMAAERLQALGFTQVSVLTGGIQGWQGAGLPVVEGAGGVWPLERQVRATAGFCVLAFSALGFTVHPYFHGLAAFMGAGLLHAAVTDSCAMAFVLAKLPWNQGAKKGAAEALPQAQ